MATAVALPANDSRSMLPYGMDDVRIVTAGDTPLTFGWLHPTLVLPTTFRNWPADYRRAVIEHECAHITRGDWLMHIVAQTVCALYWFNPCVWLAARQLAIEAECACDDCVLLAGTRPADYADYLLGAVRAVGRTRRIPSGVIAMASQTQVRPRIEAILDSRRCRTSLSSKIATIGLLVVVSASLPIAAIQLSAQADAQASAPHATAAPAATSGNHKYPGDTPRVLHTWMLNRKGLWREALAEERAIVADTNASEEERCTAEYGIAFDSVNLNLRSEASTAFNAFDRQRVSLNIDPGIVAEAARTHARLRGASDSADSNSLSRWQNANGNNWTNVHTTPENLSFTAGLKGWEKGADYSDAPDYSVGSSSQAYQGHPAGFVESQLSNPRGYALLCQWLRADAYLGKRVHVWGNLRLSGTSAHGSLFVHRDTRNRYSFWTAPNSGVPADSKWHKYSIVIDVPADGQGLIYGANLMGHGALWLSDVHIDVVGNDVPLTIGGTTR